MIFGPDQVCGYDHDHGPCKACGAVGPVGWTHECYECFQQTLTDVRAEVDRLTAERRQLDER